MGIGSEDLNDEHQQTPPSIVVQPEHDRTELLYLIRFFYIDDLLFTVLKRENHIWFLQAKSMFYGLSLTLVSGALCSLRLHMILNACCSPEAISRFMEFQQMNGRNCDNL